LSKDGDRPSREGGRSSREGGDHSSGEGVDRSLREEEGCSIRPCVGIRPFVRRRSFVGRSDRPFVKIGCSSR
jgi:hypothetical protein